ncbi:MAG: hypothetical protein RIR11_444, partial [Bacteroidota bacterium]
MCDRPRMGQMFIEQCGMYYIRPLQGRTRIETAILLSTFDPFWVG